MVRIACSEATELNSRKRDIHHPRNNRRSAEKLMRQTRPQYQRGAKHSLPSDAKDQGRQPGSQQLLSDGTSDHTKECERQLERCRQGGGLPHEGLRECGSDDHKVIARVLAEE